MPEQYRRRVSLDETLAMLLVEVAREEAVKKHGELKGGMARWEHHLMEECGEAVVEMKAIGASPEDTNAKMRLMGELAQIAQLVETMIVMLLQGRERKGEETWTVQ